jgi:hypothetical protein
VVRSVRKIEPGNVGDDPEAGSLQRESVAVVLGELRSRVEPLLRRSTFLADRVGGPVLLELAGDDGDITESLVIDFDARQMRRYANEAVRHRFTTERPLVEHLLDTGATDWVNSLRAGHEIRAQRADMPVRR